MEQAYKILCSLLRALCIGKHFQYCRQRSITETTTQCLQMIYCISERSRYPVSCCHFYLTTLLARLVNNVLKHQKYLSLHCSFFFMDLSSIAHIIYTMNNSKVSSSDNWKITLNLLLTLLLQLCFSASFIKELYDIIKNVQINFHKFDYLLHFCG